LQGVQVRGTTDLGIGGYAVNAWDLVARLDPMNDEINLLLHR
jgi:hypothetical protein